MKITKTLCDIVILTCILLIIVFCFCVFNTNNYGAKLGFAITQLVLLIIEYAFCWFKSKANE